MTIPFDKISSFTHPLMLKGVEKKVLSAYGGLARYKMGKSAQCRIYASASWRTSNKTNGKVWT